VPPTLLLVLLSGCPNVVVDAPAGTQDSTAPPPSAEKEILDFSFLALAVAGVVDREALNIRVVVPHGTDRSCLVAVFTTTGTSVTVDDTEQESGRTVNDFTEPVVYLVTAQDGSAAAYAVSVDLAPSAEKAITELSFLGVPSPSLIDPARGIVRVRVPEGADLSSLIAVFAASGARVEVSGAPQTSGRTPNDFRQPVTYTVFAEDGSTADWQVRAAAAPRLLVNELDYDQPGADSAEFVELAAQAESDLGGLVLILVNGGSIPGMEYDRIDLGAAGALPAGGFLVIAGPGVAVPAPAARLQPPGWESSNRLQNGPRDSVLVWDCVGRRIVDAVSYGGVLHRALITGEAAEVDPTEGAAAAPADSGSAAGSVSRIPSGADTGQNGTDFRFTAALTPGEANR
jgi:hypothetical protein